MMTVDDLIKRLTWYKRRYGNLDVEYAYHDKYLINVDFSERVDKVTVVEYTDYDKDAKPIKRQKFVIY